MSSVKGSRFFLPFPSLKLWKINDAVTQKRNYTTKRTVNAKNGFYIIILCFAVLL